MWRKGAFCFCDSALSGASQKVQARMCEQGGPRPHSHRHRHALPTPCGGALAPVNSPVFLVFTHSHTCADKF